MFALVGRSELKETGFVHKFYWQKMQNCVKFDCWPKNRKESFTFIYLLLIVSLMIYDLY